jgi:hypothetical protein
VARSTDDAVRRYLDALRDPSLLVDHDAIEETRSRLAEESDTLERVRLQQRLIDVQSPSADRYEDDFVTHAQAWSAEHEVGVKAFQEEGVPTEVLRRAGFQVTGGRRGRRASSGTRRKRVSSEDVRSAIPATGTFTAKSLQETSGASAGVVRKVITEEEEGGRLQSKGTDPDHSGPGRAPVLYGRS